MAETGAKRGAAKRSTSGRSASARTAPKTAAEPACTVAFCPLGRAMNATADAAPEVLGHLMNAAREVLLAVTAVLEAKPGFEKRAPTGGGSKLEKIDLG